MDSLWGKEEDIKTAEFKKAVENIETKYEDIFSDKVNIITGKTPDKLLYQFITTFDGFKRTCDFRKDTYVHKYIQEEVFDAFKSIFSSK